MFIRFIIKYEYFANNLRPSTKVVADTKTIVDAYLVDSIAFSECVEDGIHGVQHGHHLHGGYTGTDLREGDHIREQDGDTVKHLTTQDNSILQT